MAITGFSTLESALKLHRTATRWLVGGFLVLILSVAFAENVKDTANVPFWVIPLVLLVFSVIVQALASLPGVLRTLLCWLLVVIFAIWVVLLSTQVFSGNRISAIPSSTCLLRFWDAVCGGVRSDPLTTVAAANAPVEPPAPPVPPPATPETRQLVVPDTPAADASLPDASLPAADKQLARIYLQFSIYPRDVPIAMAAGLAALGWKIEGGEAGGERTGNADGLHEVRYFHESDADLARSLAKDLSGVTPGTPEIIVNDLSANEALSAKVPLHQLEIWISKLGP